MRHERATSLVLAATCLLAIATAASGARAGSGEAPAAAPVKQVRADRLAIARSYDPLPSLPRQLRQPGARHTVLLQICVTAAGAVGDVQVTRRGPPAFETALLAAVRSWRYRPLVLAGAPRPFCHQVEIRYVVP
jgi:TonB family protein